MVQPSPLKWYSMKNKDLLSKIRKGYIKIPGKILDMGLSGEAISVYVYLTSLSEHFNPGQKGINNKLKYCRNKIYKLLDELIDRNMIRVIREASPGKQRLFEFTPPKEWK